MPQELKNPVSVGFRHGTPHGLLTVSHEDRTVLMHRGDDLVLSSPFQNVLPS
jgi:hypothetical protein